MNKLDDRFIENTKLSNELMERLDNITTTEAYFVSPPTISGPSSVPAGQTATFKASGSFSAFGNRTITYHWSDSHGGSGTGSTYNVTTFTSDSNKTITVTCYATDDLGNKSKSVSYSFHVEANANATVNSVSWSSNTLYGGETYTATINASDPEGDQIYYKLTSSDSAVSISPSSESTSNSFSVTFPNYTSDTTVTFTAYARDKNHTDYSSKNVSVLVKGGGFFIRLIPKTNDITIDGITSYALYTFFVFSRPTGYSDWRTYYLGFVDSLNQNFTCTRIGSARNVDLSFKYFYDNNDLKLHVGLNGQGWMYFVVTNYNSLSGLSGKVSQENLSYDNSDIKFFDSFYSPDSGILYLTGNGYSTVYKVTTSYTHAIWFSDVTNKLWSFLYLDKFHIVMKTSNGIRIWNTTNNACKEISTDYEVHSIDSSYGLGCHIDTTKSLIGPYFQITRGYPNRLFYRYDLQQYLLVGSNEFIGVAGTDTMNNYFITSSKIIQLPRNSLSGTAKVLTFTGSSSDNLKSTLVGAYGLAFNYNNSVVIARKNLSTSSFSSKCGHTSEKYYDLINRVKSVTSSTFTRSTVHYEPPFTNLTIYSSLSTENLLNYFTLEYC